jgi:hypothetical protein
MPTPVGAPPGQRWEIEFTAGVWTDVTADVEFGFAQPQTHYGRTSQFSQPGPATETLALRNPLGRYTPQRQVLTDGVTPHPYWPNVLPRKRIRRSYTVGGVTYYRFFGYVKGFPPSLYSGVLPVVPITATDRMDQLSRVTMKSPIVQQINPDLPDLWWPLTDDAGSTQAVTSAGGSYPLVASYTGPAPAFGDNGPGVGDGTGVKFAPASSSSGQLLGATQSLLDIRNGLTVEIWVNAGTSLPAWASGAGTEAILGFATGSVPHLVLSLVNGVPWAVDSGSVAASASIVDGGWHHLAVTRGVGVTDPFTFYVDGVSQGTAASSFWPVPGLLRVGDDADPASAGRRFQGNVGQIAIYATALSAARVAAHASATNGYAGDTTDARIARYLGAAGLTASDWTLDAGQTTVGTYPQAGKDVVSACQDMATTEGGGSAFWVRPSDGDVRHTSRRYRDSTTPVLILDASIPALLDPDVWDPAFDETTLVNTSTASRSAESGTLSTQTYTDAVSVAAYGPADDGGVSTYTQSDQDALNLAQAHVAGNAYPAFQLSQLAVNFHAATSNLYPQLGAVEIGSRIRIINIPSFAAPMSTLDLFVEGWTENPTPTTHRVVFGTSPADNPPTGAWGSFRWQADGQTLNTALTNPATATVIVDTASPKPTFTTFAGSYPFHIQIGEEVITLNTAPGGSTSPQTFTGVTRGAYGTPAAYQPAGSIVQLYPATAWAF